MYNDGADPTLTNITFSGNQADYGGGIYNNSSNPTLADVTFSGNQANSYGGGMRNSSSSPTLTNVTFNGNHADYGGGGMHNYSSNPTLTNVTFSGNSANEDGGGMHNNSSNPSLTNCILWGNSASRGLQIYDQDSAPVVTYSDVQGGYPGVGNIAADPLFTDADGPDDVVGTLDDNVRPQTGSRAIDAGDGGACPATDLDGIARPTQWL